MLVPTFGMGVGELLVVLVVVLLVFGPGRLPEMMGGNLGTAMREFQKGLREPPEVAGSTPVTRSRKVAHVQAAGGWRSST